MLSKVLRWNVTERVSVVTTLYVEDSRLAGHFHKQRPV